MSDSVDRVFVHALNTVKKIPRTGSARPPPADRLKLYGLYKQSMEGNVEGVMDRPSGDGADVQAEKEKWNAWYAQKNLSRTEAKRRYITTLIETMHRYAAPTPEARELISELEFVWDQIKSNTASSSSSSPVQMVRPHHLHSHGNYDSIGGRMARADDNQMGRHSGRDSRLRVLSPVSQPEEQMMRRRNYDRMPGEEQGDEDEDDDEDEEEFQEARDSFYGDEDQDEDDVRQQRPHIDLDIDREKRSRRWRRRVEQALTKMTAEIAAMRELMETRAQHNGRRRTIWVWVKWLVWLAIKQICWDIVLLGVICVWLRLRGDRRVEERIKYIWAEFKKRLSKVRFRRYLTLAELTLDSLYELSRRGAYITKFEPQGPNRGP
ncbi:hypothetical protein CIRG_03762 [Coccidioides immitis RMSCC 2394]|uniref:ACB domain-containing protein n=1 Tax=Coccidioides immitis RMSCC 2394 TaxID=404692 RepID=A0A0J6Y603_COCIT|nr:hypothetical protein CIRG_03762 [Coccidioides immitis RMSCC 2394]